MKMADLGEAKTSNFKESQYKIYWSKSNDLRSVWKNISLSNTTSNKCLIKSSFYTQNRIFPHPIFVSVSAFCLMRNNSWVLCYTSNYGESGVDYGLVWSFLPLLFVIEFLAKRLPILAIFCTTWQQNGWYLTNHRSNTVGPHHTVFLSILAF